VFSIQKALDRKIDKLVCLVCVYSMKRIRKMEELVRLVYQMKITIDRKRMNWCLVYSMKGTRQEEDELVFSILNEKD
jgi:hypothetical protein